MSTKYIVNNVTGQTISGGLKISGDTYVISTPPTSITGTTGDTVGKLAIDSNYLYYCSEDFVASVPGEPVVVSGGAPTHIFNAEPGTEWNGYGDNYLQTGPPQEEGVIPQNGWYIVDDNGTTRQVIGGFWLSPLAPYPNGTGWIMTLDGPFTYSVDNPTITFYETLPTVTGGGQGTAGSGNIWRTVKLDYEKNDTRTYSALLTQTGSITGYSLEDFDNALIIGETYTINDYVSDDDFSNIANVISGNINETNCQFIATGDTPTKWTNGSELVSDGGLVVNVVKNELGYELEWNTFIGNGSYIAFPTIIGTKYNNFPRTKTSVFTQQGVYPPPFGFPFVKYICGTASLSSKDDIIAFSVYDTDISDGVNDALYYTPVEIKIKVDLDTAPVVINGTVTPSYPFNNASVDLICNENYVESFYGGGTTVNNFEELLTQLNSDEQTSYLGTYSNDGEGGIILTMSANLVNRFCSNGTLTFEIFND